MSAVIHGSPPLRGAGLKRTLDVCGAVRRSTGGASRMTAARVPKRCVVGLTQPRSRVPPHFPQGGSSRSRKRPRGRRAAFTTPPSRCPARRAWGKK